jgi:hypothetical protein
MAKVLLISLLSLCIICVNAASSKDVSGSITIGPGNYTTTDFVQAPFWISFTISSKGNITICTIDQGTSFKTLRVIFFSRRLVCMAKQIYLPQLRRTNFFHFCYRSALLSISLKYLLRRPPYPKVTLILAYGLSCL